MARKFNHLIIMLLTATVFTVNAKTVVWSVKPTYENITPYNEKLYLCQMNGKWGMIDANGKSVLPTQYDFIISADEEIGMYGIQEGDRYRIEGFISTTGAYKTTILNGPYYAIPQHLAFSEGKLCVSNKSGKQGFLDTSGNEVIKCKFDAVHPFKEGLASVKKSPWVYYIMENYSANPNMNVVYSEWRSGQITSGTSFKNGEAVVGYGDTYKVIDKQGRPIRSFKAAEWRVNNEDYTIRTNQEKVQEQTVPAFKSPISLCTANGLFGFECNGEAILAPVFASASEIDVNNLSIVSHKGKTGLIRIIDGEINTGITYNNASITSIFVDLEKNPDEIQYICQTPYQQDQINVEIDPGNGIFQNVTQAMTAGTGRMTFKFKPAINDQDETVCIRSRISYDAILVHEDTASYKIERPILRLSSPEALTKQADINTELQHIGCTVYNDSSREVTITASLSVKCIENENTSKSIKLTIPAKSSENMSMAVKVITDETVSATIRLSTGKSRSSNVELKIY